MLGRLVADAKLAWRRFWEAFCWGLDPANVDFGEDDDA